MGPVHVWGHTQFLPVLPESRIHAQIPPGGGGGRALFCPRARNCIFFYLLQITSDKVFRQAKKKQERSKLTLFWNFAGIFPNVAQLWPELDTSAKLGGGGTVPPPLPPSHTPMVLGKKLILEIRVMVYLV